MSYKELICCNMCEGRLTASPRHLPCLHTFCEKCLNDKILPSAIESIIAQKNKSLVKDTAKPENESVDDEATGKRKGEKKDNKPENKPVLKSASSEWDLGRIGTREKFSDIVQRRRFSMFFMSRLSIKQAEPTPEVEEQDEKQTKDVKPVENTNPFENSFDNSSDKNNPFESENPFENTDDDENDENDDSGKKKETEKEEEKDMEKEKKVEANEEITKLSDDAGTDENLEGASVEIDNSVDLAVKITPGSEKDTLCLFTRVFCPKCQNDVRLSVEISVVEPYTNDEEIHKLLLDKFPVNTFAEYLLEAEKRTQEEQKCQPCFKRKTSKVAISWCVQCGHGYCEMCTELHKGFDPFRSHNIFDIAKNNNEKLLGVTSYCSKHLDFFTMFCDSCQRTMCLQCSAQHYKEKHANEGQQPVLLSGVANEKRKEGESFLKRIVDEKEEKKNFILELNKLISNLRTKKATLVKEVDTRIAEIVENLQTDATIKLSLEIGQIISAEEEEVRNEIRRTEIQLGILNQIFCCLDSAMDEAQDEQLMAIVQQVDRTFQFKETVEQMSGHVISNLFLKYNNELASFLKRLREFPIAEIVQHFPGDTIPKLELLIGEIGNEGFVKEKAPLSETDEETDKETDKTESSSLSESPETDIQQYTLKRTPTYLLPGNNTKLMHAFLGSINEVSNLNQEILLFEVLFIAEGRIIVSDFHSQNIKEFDDDGHLLACCEVAGAPTGICIISDHMIACVLPWNKSLCFIMRDGRSNFLAISTTVSVEKQYIGVAMMDSQRLICSSDNFVDLIGFDGVILQSLSTLSGEHGLLLEPRYITIFPNTDYFLLSDVKRAALICCNIDGDVKFLYTGSNKYPLSKPSGVCVDENNYIYLADTNKDCIHRLSENGKFDRILFTKRDGIRKPRGLGISPNGQKLYLSELDSGIVKVFNTNRIPVQSLLKSTTE